MSDAIVPMPVPPNELFRVNPFYPFEEGGRRLMLVVENAAFAEADEPAWALASMLAGHDRVRRSDLFASLKDRFGEGEAGAALETFERLEILAPHSRPKMMPDLLPIELHPLSSLTLHVAHDCNMRCGYCYADFGRYGGAFGVMDEAVALEHVDRFFDGLQCDRSKTAHVTFFGGEPLLNMPVVYAAHARAKERAAREGRAIAFGITTNGTLLTEELAAFFATERFTVTVSIDGPADVNDRLRPLQDGSGSYDRIMERVRSVGLGTGLRTIARVTLTRRSTDVARIVRHLVDVGFHEVGVAPVTTGDPRFDLSTEDLGRVLEGMEQLAEDFVAAAKRRELFPFSNLRSLVEQIASGEPRAIPCGAGTQLVAADKDGDLYACHRFVGEARFKIGDLRTGVDAKARLRLVSDLHPRTREPCGSCWARYLCGGGCHHIAWVHSRQEHGDAAHRAGDPADAAGAPPWVLGTAFCDFLRGWYRLGLVTYARLAEEAPEFLDGMRRRAGHKMPCSQPAGQ